MKMRSFLSGERKRAAVGQRSLSASQEECPMRALRAAALCGHVDLVDLPQSLAAAFRYLQDRLRPYALARRDVVYI